jgi:DNA-binding response OmpR family regulator
MRTARLEYKLLPSHAMSAPELHFPDKSKVFPGPTAKPLSIPLPPSTGEKTRVLVADEDPVNRLTLFQFLTEAGYEVVITENGHEAIAELRRTNHPVVAVLDLTLPGMSGGEICKRMRSVEKLVYLILSSDDTGKEEAAAALESGADSYLARPIVREELLAVVKSGLRIIGRQRALAQKVEALGGHRSADDMA